MISLPVATLICRQSFVVVAIVLIIVATKDFAAGISYGLGGGLVVVADTVYFWRLNAQLKVVQLSSEQVFGLYLKAVLGKTALIFIGLALLFWFVGAELRTTQKEYLFNPLLVINLYLLTTGVVITAIFGSLSNALVISKEISKWSSEPLLEANLVNRKTPEK